MAIRERGLFSTRPDPALPKARSKAPIHSSIGKRLTTSCSFRKSAIWPPVFPASFFSGPIFFRPQCSLMLGEAKYSIGMLQFPEPISEHSIIREERMSRPGPLSVAG